MEQDVLNMHYEGFAKGNMEMMEALTKALEAGTGVDVSGFTGGRAIIPESLDATLVSVLWKQEHAKLFRALKKKPVKSPVHQWARRTGVGDDDGAFVAEGGSSVEKNTDLERKWAEMKYLQTLRKVTLQATISLMLEDAMTIEKQSGTLWVIKQTERVLFNGDSDMIAEESNGLYKLLTDNVTATPPHTENVIDIRGQVASSIKFEESIVEAARVITGKFGIATDLYLSLMAMEDVQRLLRDRLRFPVGKGETTLPNLVFDHFPTAFGTVALQPDLFLVEGQEPRTSVIDGLPSQPVLDSLTRENHADSKFVTADAGDYYYRISAVNKFGQSVKSAEAQVTGVIAGDRVVLPMTSEGATPGTCFFVFRSKKNAGASSKLLYAYKVKRAGATMTLYDYNGDLPGTSQAYILGMNPMYDAIEWLQFLPLMKFDLFPANAAIYPFLMLLYGALGLKKPEHQVMIKNISPSGLGWF